MNLIFMHLALLGDTWVIVLLIGASVVSIGVMIDRAKVFNKNRGDLAALMDGLAASLEKRDIPGAVAQAEKSERVEARVALAGLMSFPKGAAAVEEVMVARWLRERMELEKYLIVLGTLGNNAPFIGLLGTVLGVIRAFRDLGVSGGQGPEVVMQGISEALVATAIGILVALPCVVFYNYFQKKIKDTLIDADRFGKQLIGILETENPSVKEN